MILYAEVECILYESHSLKQKRSIIKPVLTKCKKDFNIAMTELDYHDLWQRTKLGIVTISTELAHAEQVMQDVMHVIDSYTELERTITHVERI
ncbi:MULTISPECIES: DUF503 domain-containing protein [Clostridia]|uniref:DUF503 domain-containing protein n=1 Tax=Clostridia TaxID=186801 RepID=UPI000EA383E5|nr:MULTISPECIES: DUF503 domain-containing protein [Clostridia]NBJ68355.1 DUF503 family protein [Roseburia sp. 1XD42-34]RKI81443.1 DUF503 family protein [Clostridium sp. 1xD42-85]